MVVPGWPKLPFPFSTALISNAGVIHVSGMQGFDFAAHPPAMVPGGIANQTTQTLKNIHTVLAAAQGATMDDLLECSVLLRDLKNFETMNSVYKTFFGAAPPARVAYQAALAGGAEVEIKCTGEVPK